MAALEQATERAGQERGEAVRADIATHRKNLKRAQLDVSGARESLLSVRRRISLPPRPLTLLVRRPPSPTTLTYVVKCSVE